MTLLPKEPWVDPLSDEILSTLMKQTAPAKQQIFYVLSGGFDPVTDAHVELINTLKYPVWIILNSDNWLEKKKGVKFMPADVRGRIMKGLKNVYDVTVAVDSEDGSVTDTLRLLASFNQDKAFIFVNSGDRKPDTTPEYEALNEKHKNLKFEWVESTNPTSHSSKYLEEWKNKSVSRLHVDPLSGKVVPASPYNGDPLLGIRPWGKWLIIKEDEYTRHKLLVVNPHSALSLQRHKNRSESWRVMGGYGSIRLSSDDPNAPLERFVRAEIKAHEWHQLVNDSDAYLVVYEVQKSSVKFGCEEADIERV